MNIVYSANFKFLLKGWPAKGVRDVGSHAGLTLPVNGDGKGVEGTNGQAEGGMEDSFAGSTTPSPSSAFIGPLLLLLLSLF